jgi:hypothetical protein
MGLELKAASCKSDKCDQEAASQTQTQTQTQTNIVVYVQVTIKDEGL